MVIIILLFSFLIHSSVTQEFRKICSTTPTDSACQQLARTPNLRCNYNQHNVDCLLNIQNNKSHFGRITGEDGMLGSNILSNEVVVLGEIRKLNPTVQTVVILKNDIPNDFKNWQNRSLCHPGYNHVFTVPHFMLKEIENYLIREINPECNENVTILERHVKALSNFLGDSCRPGVWSQNTEFDNYLKVKYPNLCKLCGNGCDVDNTEPFKNSLDCLVKNNADIALTTLEEAESFFANSNYKQNYKYVCKDGRPSSTSCVWSSKTSDLLVAQKSVAKEVESLLRENLGSFINTTQSKVATDAIGESLSTILNLQNDQITLFEETTTPTSLRSYIFSKIPTIPTPSTNGQCGRTINWCTRNSKEHEKCTWLQNVAVLWGIEPTITCVQSDIGDELNCMNDIKNRKADIFVASSNNSYIALSKDLSGIAFPEIDSSQLLLTLAVKRENDSSITSFQDLRQKRACFSKFGGREQLSFVEVITDLNLTDKTCNYAKILNDFVGDSCIPGVQHSLVDEATQNIDKTKFCQQCRRFNDSISDSETCSVTESNMYSGDEGALRCLNDIQGDFAIITAYSQNVGNFTDFRVICKNGSLASNVGLDVDSNCALFGFTTSEVVTRVNDSKNDDIKLVLYEFERWFGQNLKKSFHLFDKFDDEPNLLFLDSTLGLNFDGSVSYIQSYQEILKKAGVCASVGSGSETVYLHSVLFLFFYTFHFLLRLS